jgi:hypothetical protein
VFWGFLKGYFRRLPRVEDLQFIHYIRSQQLRRLCGLETIVRNSEQLSDARARGDLAGYRRSVRSTAKGATRPA